MEAWNKDIEDIEQRVQAVQAILGGRE